MKINNTHRKVIKLIERADGIPVLYDYFAHEMGTSRQYIHQLMTDMKDRGLIDWENQGMAKIYKIN